MTAAADALPPPPLAIDYVERWRQIVERRRAQMDAAYAAAGLSSDDYWAKRAKNYREALHSRMDDDPYLRRVRAAINPGSTVIDVGAGTGRHTLALAPQVHSVTAIDPAAAMLAFLREDLAANSIKNVNVVESDWLAADVAPADIVSCSHVLYPIADVVPFLRKLDRSARERVFIYLRTDPLPTDMGLWAEFYGVPLQLQPVHTDLMNVLVQIGIMPDVEVVQHRFTWTFATFDDAVAQVGNSLCLRPDDRVAQSRLAGLLRDRLVPWPDGRLGPEVGSARSAIVSWRPDPA